MKQIGLGFKQYFRDYDGRFPIVNTNSTKGWAESLRFEDYMKSHLRSVFRCPENNVERNAALTDYFYNSRLSALKTDVVKFPTATIVSGDGNLDAPPTTAISSLPQGWRDYKSSPAYRHMDGANYLFVDGHVKWMKVDKVILKAPKKSDVYTFLPR